MKSTAIQKTAVIAFILGFLSISQLSAQTNLYRIVSPTGQTVSYVEYDNAYEYAHGLVAVQLGNHWGYIDGTGKVVIPSGKPFYFDAAETFGKHGLALVWANGKYKFINPSGNDAFPLQFDEAYGFDEAQTTVVKLNDKWGLIDLKGNFVIPAKYEGINRYEQLATVYDGEKFALFHTNGQALTPFIYDNLGSQLGLMFEDRIPVRQNDRWGFIDGTGKTVIAVQYEEVGRFSEGLVGFMESGKAGYLDKYGKLVVPPIYENIDQFSESLAAVSKDNLWGYIGKKGELLIPFAFSSAGRFTDGKAYVSRSDNAFYIDKAGKQVAEPSFADVSTEPPKLSLKAVEAPMEVSLTYPDLNLKVDKLWQAHNGTAINGKVYDTRTNRLVGEELVFERGKITKGKFYADGRSLLLTFNNGIMLADLEKTIASEASKSVKAVASSQTTTPNRVLSPEEKDKFMALYKELNALFKQADDEYWNYSLKVLEYDTEASNDAERKANLHKKIKPYQDMLEAIIFKCQYLLENDPQLSPENREILTVAIPKYQAMLDKLRGL